MNTKYFDFFATTYERSWSDLDYWSYHARINWNYTIAACMSYCLLVYLGQYMMKSHKGFNLRLPLILWNTILAVFSILAAVRIVPYTLTTLVQNGAWYFVCRNGMASYGQGGTVALWSVLFVCSKYFELIDTALLILRKKQVSFLHWFHHASVVLLSINALAYYSPSALIMSGMNSLVHTVMYTYYAIAAIRTRPPRRWGKLVTKLQLVQMWVGVFLGVANYLGQRIIDNCHSVPSHNALILGIYVSYLVLFTRFYFTKY